MIQNTSIASSTKTRGWHGNSEGHANAGRKGGATVSQDKAHMAEIGRRGGSKVAADRNYMAEIGRRGGQVRSQRMKAVQAQPNTL